MNINPENTWWPDSKNSATSKYIAAHYEFWPDHIVSGVPYSIKTWNVLFKSIPGTNAWKLKRDHIMNGLTADLLAAAESLGQENATNSFAGSPRGIGAEETNIWVPIADGGIFLTFSQSEHEYTNKVQARQATIILGAAALRMLIKKLGIGSPSRLLKGEKSDCNKQERKPNEQIAADIAAQFV